MAESDFSPYDWVHYLKELKDEEFLKFKELLREEPEKFQLQPISWSKLQKASKDELAELLDEHYPGQQAWEMIRGLFLQLNRKDLCTKVQEQMASKPNKYKQHMKKKFQLIWDNEGCRQIPESFYKQIIKAEYEALKDAFSEPGAITMVVEGPEGQGRTAFLRKVMLDWAEGNLWKDRFTFVFFIYVYELNSMSETSLVELISREWPGSLEMINDIFSKPERILFILDGFDGLKFDLEVRTNLCDDWRQRQPIQIVLSSLLQKRMLPDSSLILELGKQSLPKIYYLLQFPRSIFMTGLPKELTEPYFQHFFCSKDKGSEAFRYLKTDISPFLELCRNLRMCWMACSCLKWQYDRGDKYKIVADTDSSTYTSFVVSSFKSRTANCPSKQNRDRLRKLCTLAAEGMWHRTFVFSTGDLRKIGITESDEAMWLGMRFLLKRGNCFVFHNHTLQAYFAALFYFLRQTKDKPNPAIGSLPELLREVYVHFQTHWLQIGMFLFGISTERSITLLQQSIGFLPSKEIRQEVIKYLKSLGQHKHIDKVIRSKDLLPTLLEVQEGRFETQVMDLFEELTTNVFDSETLLEASNCLDHCNKIRKLHLCVHNNGVCYLHCRAHIHFWGKLCSVFSKNFQALELDSCNFNETSFKILCEALSSPVCKLQSLTCSFMSDIGNGSLLFQTIAKNSCLKYLNLYGTKLSCHSVGSLCQVLQDPSCKVEDLLLGKCSITSPSCRAIASVVLCNKVKRLSLVENPVKNKGVRLLCEALKQPTCALETLLLSYCCLTFVACGHIYEALLSNKSLSLLDLASNHLEDNGIISLCEALKSPNCPLQALWLSGCSLTLECCEDLSAVLVCNKRLKTLKLGNNYLVDAGVQLLFEALRNPNCKLQSLGIDMCYLSNDCCEDLVSTLTTCKTLKSLNLAWITLDHDRLVMLCEALLHKSCTLKVL
uniref:NACHT, LRR and PYD domains-containing protein 9B n=1 Tax=Nannospalax galili TaxID=1026970 RepID=A0A8C6RK83_NANGA